MTDSARKTTEAAEDEWITVEEAQRALGNGRSTVLNLVIAGVLVGKHIAKRTVIRRDSVEAEMARRDAIVSSD